MTHPFYLNQSLIPTNFPAYPNLMAFNPAMTSVYQSQLNLLALAQKEQERQATLLRLKEFNLQRQIQNFCMAQQIQNKSLYCEQASPLKASKVYSHPSSSEIIPSRSETRATSYKSDMSEAEVSEKMKNKGVQENLIGSQLKSQISQMLTFFINEFKKINHEKVLEQRNLYAFNPVLLKLFDELVEKYSSSTKCREDMMRFVLRKALSFLRDSLRDKKGLTARAASLALCQKYFQLESDEITNQVNLQDDKELLSFLLPYKKNSRNKTANTKFMTEIFASEAFYQDYLEYLEKFDGILGSDNQKKIARFSEFLFSCVKENKIEKIRNYKRLPWLKVWEETTKVIAYEMLSARSGKKIGKSQEAVTNKKQKITIEA